jgi:cobalt/nickel transport system permease protein
MSSALREGPIARSPLSRWDARWKLAGVAVAIVAVALVKSPVVLGVAVCLACLLLLLSRASLVPVLQRLALLWLGLLPIVLVLGYSVENGWLLAFAIVLRTTTIAGLMLVLILTTPSSILCAAAHQLGVPGVLVQVVALAWRYARLFLAELQRMRIALFCRGFRLQTTGHAFRTLGHAAGTLMVRGADRSDRVSEAMLARGFHGKFQSLHEFRTRQRDILGFLLLMMTVAGLVVWDRLA